MLPQSCGSPQPSVWRSLTPLPPPPRVLLPLAIKSHPGREWREEPRGQEDLASRLLSHWTSLLLSLVTPRVASLLQQHSVGAPLPSFQEERVDEPARAPSQVDFVPLEPRSELLPVSLVGRVSAAADKLTLPPVLVPPVVPAPAVSTSFIPFTWSDLPSSLEVTYGMDNHLVA